MPEPRREENNDAAIRDYAPSPAPVKQTEQKDPAAGPLRIDGEDLDTSDGYDRYWQGKPFTGTELEFDANGRLLSEVKYDDGVEHGFTRQWYSYPDHLRKETFSYFNRFHNLWREWYSNQQLQYEALYEKATPLYERHWDEQGRPHGLWKKWYPYKYRSLFPTTKSESLYENGMRLHERHWDARERPIENLPLTEKQVVEAGVESLVHTRRLTWKEKHADHQ